MKIKKNVNTILINTMKTGVVGVAVGIGLICQSVSFASMQVRLESPEMYIDGEQAACTLGPNSENQCMLEAKGNNIVTFTGNHCYNFTDEDGQPVVSERRYKSCVFDPSYNYCKPQRTTCDVTDG